ncbi:MAG TPA: hypothetical protein VHL56_00605 [Candidatus Limnocylindrales bacterium]|nr:hypothetical protein [Candidatus Limnocylindrales bacterium]
MRRGVVVGAIVALALAGCADNREVVPLNYVDVPSEHGCYLSGPSYFLVADPSFGVALKMSELDGSRYKVYWPRGYIAHRVGTEVEVSGPSGRVVAVTGHQYMFPAMPGDDSGTITAACIMGFQGQ